MIFLSKQINLLTYIFIFIPTLNLIVESGLSEWKPPLNKCALQSYDKYTDKLGSNGVFKIPGSRNDPLIDKYLHGDGLACIHLGLNVTAECQECKETRSLYCDFGEQMSNITKIYFPLDYVEIRVLDDTDTSQAVFPNIEVSTLKIVQMSENLMFQDNTIYGLRNVNTLIMENDSEMFQPLPNLDQILSEFTNLTSLYLQNYRITIDWQQEEECENKCNKELLLPNLEILSLENSMIEGTTFTMFNGSNISYLTIVESVFNFTTDILVPIKESLLYLEMHEENLVIPDITTLLSGLKHSDGSTILEGLSLTDVAIENVAGTALETVSQSLKYLSLNKNKISAIRAKSEDPDSMFPEMPKLQELDLSCCQLECLEDGVFNKMENLEFLILSGNNLKNIGNNFLQNLQNLRYLDFSSSSSTIEPSVNVNNIDFAHVPMLEILDFSWTKLGKVSKFHGLGDSLKQLSLCHSLHFLDNLSPESLQNSSSLEVLDLSGLQFKTQRKSAQLLQLKELVSLKQLYLRSSDIPSLQELINSQLLMYTTSLEYIDMTENKLKYFDNKPFQNLQNLKTLILRDNQISGWSSRMITDTYLSQLKYLDIKSNKVTYISKEMVEDFTKLETLYLCKNYFKCECDGYKEFMNFVHNSNETIVYDDEDNIENCLVCESKIQDMVKIEDFLNGDCNTLFPTWAYITLAVFALLLTAAGISYWKWWEIRHFFHIVKDATVLSFMDNAGKIPFKNNLFVYDIFVSYCDANREWVLDYLLPNLEDKSSLTVCLHERDFQVGLSILENIITSMDRSRSILLVISRSFLRSNWCQFELHLAQHRLLETRREELILVLLEDIPKYKRPKMLQYLMKTKTYLLWPRSETDHAGRHLFWKRLCQATILHKSVSDDKQISVI